MKTTRINPQSLLSTLWIFILFNIIFRDLHQFLAEGYIQDMIDLRLSEKSLLFYAFILEIPIAMVLLTRILMPKTNKWFNLIAASIMLIGLLFGLPSADLDDIFFTVVNMISLVAIGRIAILRLQPQNIRKE